MWDLAPSDERPRGDSLKLLAAGLVVAALVFVAGFFADKLEPQWRWLQKKIPYPNSHVMFGIFVTIVLAIFFFPRRAGNVVEWLLDQTLFRFLGPKKDGKDLE
jgi:MFS family permease